MYAIDNHDPRRISATDAGGHEIAGAWIPPGGAAEHDIWKLYLTVAVDHHALRHHPVVCSRDGAMEWVEAIAALYSSIQELKAELARRRP